MTAPGIILNMPDAEYRAAAGYGSTALKWFLEEVPAQAKHWIDHPEDAPSFESAHLGQLFHALTLGQPHNFIVKDWSLSTKVGKERAADVLEEHGGVRNASLSAAEFDEAFAAAGVSLLTAADFELARNMAEGARRHPTVRALLERPGSGEASAFAEVDGVRVKARLDWLPEPSDQRMVVLDLKSAISAHPRKFTSNAARFEYAVQHGAYLDVLDAVLGPMPHGMEPEFLFVVTDKRPPFLTSLVGLPQLWAQIGREKAAKARRIIRECEESGVWPDFGPGIHYIDAPTWYVMQSEDEEIQV